MRNIIIQTISVVFIFLFTYTAISKLLNLEQFARTLSHAPYLKNISGFTAVAIPVIELLISLMLFFPASRRPGLLCALLLMAAFTLYIAYMLVFVASLPCSCGGILQTLSWSEHLTLNALLTISAYAAWLAHPPTQFFIAINRFRRTPV